MAWLDHLRAYDKHYQDALRKTWGKMVPVLEEMIRDGGVIDRYADQIRRSWIRNNEKWNLSRNADQCFEAQILELKEFIMRSSFFD